MFYNYDHRFVTVPDMPVAMTAEVGEFLANNTGKLGRFMPGTEFGADDPDTNSAVRLLGANGYEPWDKTLTAGSTFVQDEREGIPPTYIISASKTYYHARAYGS